MNVTEILATLVRLETRLADAEQYARAQAEQVQALEAERDDLRARVDALTADDENLRPSNKVDMP